MGQSSIPVGSMVAALFICIGTGMFCGTAYVGFTDFNNMLDLTHYEAGKLDGWSMCVPAREDCEEDVILLDKFSNASQNSQISVICFSSVMIFMTVYFLFQAFMATAANSKMDLDFTDSRIVCGGKCCSFTSVIFSFLLTLVWLAIFGASVYLFLLTLFIYKQEDLIPTPTTLDLRLYAINSTAPLVFPSNQDITGITTYAYSAFIMFCIMTSSAFLVLLGLIILSMCLTANYAESKSSTAWFKYNETKRKEERELQSYNNTAMAVTDTSNLALNGF